MGGLPSPIEATSIWKGIWHGEVHHSTAIEGNTLIQREVEQLLEERLAVGNRTLREYLEVKGYAGAEVERVLSNLSAGGYDPEDLESTTVDLKEEAGRRHNGSVRPGSLSAQIPHPHERRASTRTGRAGRESEWTGWSPTSSGSGVTLPSSN